MILVTAHADIPTCKQAMNEGAYDYIEKPLDLEYFRAQVNRAAEKAALQKQNQVLQEQLIGPAAGFEGIIGTSRAMQKVVQTARQVAASDIPVLIMGESGTGKELIARAIHNNSRRRKQRLVALNCAGLEREHPRRRAVRPREGRLHRRQHRSRRPLRARRRRHALHGRDRRHAAAHAGQAAARAGERRGRAARLQRADQGGRPPDQRHQPATSTRWSPTSSSARTCTSGSRA